MAAATSAPVAAAAAPVAAAAVAGGLGAAVATSVLIPGQRQQPLDVTCPLTAAAATTAAAVGAAV